MPHETNKWQIRHELESNGWWVAYGDEIGSEEYFEFAAAIAASVAAENPSPVIVFLNQLISRGLAVLATNAASQFGQQLANLSKQLILEAIDEAVREGRVCQFALGGIDVQIGIAKYWRREILDVPDVIANPISDISGAIADAGNAIGDAISGIFRRAHGQAKGIVEVPGTRHLSFQPFIRIRIQIGTSNSGSLSPACVVTLYNEEATDFNISFYWLVGNDWQGGTFVVPAHGARFWWQNNARACYINFDFLPQPGFQAKGYNLDANVIWGRQPTAEDGRKYLIRYLGDYWEVFAAVRDLRTNWFGSDTTFFDGNGGNWTEVLKPTGSFFASFNERHRDRDYLYLYDASRNLWVALGRTAAYSRVGDTGEWLYLKPGFWGAVKTLGDDL